ncbi:hypothetical protein [Microtetraspora sp. AC03309]|uniref:hypothetical protein n=1 Tax=Microtetraspora sp. AC03309 TaxID=2779376 RepID=UPI001E4C568E|nr:hypothetical protein [Microtetraspora sp. AC03309]
MERPAFARVAAAAHPGDTLTLSDLFRLCRDLVDIHAVRDWRPARDRRRSQPAHPPQASIAV